MFLILLFCLSLRIFCFFLIAPQPSMIVPKGQIHPQKNLPKITVNTIIIIEKIKPARIIRSLIVVKIMIKGSNLNITEGETFRNRYAGIKDVNIGMKALKAIEYYRYKQSPESFMIGFKKVEEIIELGAEFQGVYILLGLYNLLSIEMGLCENTMICFGRATEAAKKALSFDENNSDVHILLAYLFLLRNEHDNSIKEAKRAISLNPNNGDAYTSLGFMLIYYGKPDDAIPFIKKAIRIDPIPPTIYLFHLGIAYQESKQYNKAIDVFKNILDREPNHRGTLHRLAGTYSMVGDEENAKIAASELLKAYPNFKLSGYLSKLPYKNKADLERYINYLRKAGLPE